MGQGEYLVVHGLAGVIGRFRAEPALALARGDAVVVRGGRGVELGEVVRPSSPRHAALTEQVGELLRPAGEDDQARAREMKARAARLVARAEELAAERRLPVAVLDAEVLLDGEHGTLVHVRREECDVREWVRPLSVEFGLALTAVDLTAEPKAVGCGSCGDGGCGSCGTGGGCGSGSCGGATPEELRAYFAGLRKQMEGRRVALL